MDGAQARRLKRVNPLLRLRRGRRQGEGAPLLSLFGTDAGKSELAPSPQPSPPAEPGERELYAVAVWMAAGAGTFMLEDRHVWLLS